MLMTDAAPSAAEGMDTAVPAAARSAIARLVLAFIVISLSFQGVSGTGFEAESLARSPPSGVGS
jgi:hypothetical protein